ncbi:hypothetical protein LJR225_004385 [Phenylobacterium sp. LjRoot225]|uniref:hypothetical protein n=1 Tax=Phenylobacterium sp. LjRoot225 TaxID=3342285 RepID=UPI003ECD359A
MMRYLSAIALALLIAAPAAASEPLATAGRIAAAPFGFGPDDVSLVPPLGSYRALPPALDDGSPNLPPGASGCSEVADRKPHGEVWAGVGTHGYRNVGTAMTAPVGKCGSLSIMVDRTEGGGLYGWRR